MIHALLEKIVPTHVQKLEPYQSARRIGGKGRIWLNANELEEGIEFAKTQQDVSTLDANRYPDFLPHEVADDYLAYCEKHFSFNNQESKKSQAVAVRGADEAIDLLVRGFCAPTQDSILICTPTYGMYEFCADAMAINTQKVPLNSEFQLDLDAIIPKLDLVNLVFLCSPNNPTGNIINKQDIETLLEKSQDKAIVVVDEAYIEFAPEASVLDLMAKYPHLVVIRTLSKAFGLASVRCGFLIASEEVMAVVSKVIPPYPLADVAAKIAKNALDVEGVELMQAKTQELIATKNKFIEGLENLSIVEKVYASATNFVLIKFKPDTCFYQYLLSKEIVTRNQAHELVLQNCVRISIGCEESMGETLQALQDYSSTNK